MFTKSVGGVCETWKFDETIIKSPEVRALLGLQSGIQEFFEKPGVFESKTSRRIITGPTDLGDALLEIGRQGMTISRFKGLGEMNPDQLWETTLDPEARTLLQVKLEHIEETEKIFSTLMGDVVEPRREFIQSNALKVTNLDT